MSHHYRNAPNNNSKAENPILLYEAEWDERDKVWHFRRIISRVRLTNIEQRKDSVRHAGKYQWLHSADEMRTLVEAAYAGRHSLLLKGQDVCKSSPTEITKKYLPWINVGDVGRRYS